MPEASKIRCVLDLRDVPPSAFLLPGEKEANRQWRHNCFHRCMLLNYLATFADSDGGNVRPAVERMASRHEKSRRTIFYWLDDLKALGFISDGKLTGFKGTRNRAINMDAVLKAASVVQSSQSSGVQSSPSVVQSSQEQECNLHTPVVQSSHEKHAETHEDCTQPYQTALPTALPTGDGWEGWIRNLPSELDGAIPTTEQRTQIQQQINQHGSKVIAEAVRRWVEVREMDVAGLRFNKWGAWLRECVPHITWALKQEQQADEKARLAPITEALVQKQMREHAAFMESQHAPTIGECEPEIE